MAFLVEQENAITLMARYYPYGKLRAWWDTKYINLPATPTSKREHDSDKHWCFCSRNRLGSGSKTRARLQISTN